MFKLPFLTIVYAEFMPGIGEKKAELRDVNSNFKLQEKKFAINS